MEMSGNHRCLHNTIHILRTAIITKRKDIRRNKSIEMRVRYLYIHIYFYKLLYIIIYFYKFLCYLFF